MNDLASLAENHITLLNLEFDKDLLFDIYYSNVDKEDYYLKKDGTYATFWKVTRLDYNEYANYLMEQLGLEDIKFKPRFYCLEKNASLPMHIDRNTECSINIVMSDSPSPIEFELGEVYYDAALINVQQMHRVVNNNHDRFIFKLSIFDHTYKSVRDRICITYKK